VSLSFLRAAREAPDRVAVAVEGKELTFAELAPRVAGEMGTLASRGLGGRAPRRARLVANASVDFLVRLYALLEVGIPTILIHPRLLSAERDAAGRIDPEALDLEGIPPAAAGRVPAAVRDPGDGEAVVVLTSGTSATPKGVVLSRRALLAAAAASAARLEWRDDDRWLLSLTPAHVGGLSIITRCLIARRPVVLPEAGDVATLEGTVTRDRVTLLSLVAAQLERLMERSERPAPPLRAILTGGGPVGMSLLAEAARRGWPVCPTYGLSETCSQVATQMPGGAPDPSAGVGPPLPGVNVRVVDGEIQVRGGVLMDRYLPMGAHASPFTSDGWLATGDLGRLDERGNLHVLGRGDDLIVTGGENVAPVEVEDVLRGCPGVRAALVFGVPDRTWGSVVAVAIVADQPPPRETAVTAWLAQRLAPFKRPRRIVFVEGIPLTPSGKPDRRAAAEAWAERLRSVD